MQSTLKIVSIFICLILAFSPLAFASDFSSDPEQEPLDVESVPDPWLSLESKTMELRATEKTITDVYNILNSGLMSGNTPKLDNIYSNISSNLEFWVGSQRYSIADLQGMTWRVAQDIEGDLGLMIQQGTSLISETQRTNAKLEYVFSAIEDTINIKWYDSGFVYDNTSLTLNGSALSSQTSARQFFVKWHATGSYYPNTPCILRLFFPINRHSVLLTNSDIFHVDQLYATSYVAQMPDHFTQLTSGGFYLYLFDFKPYTSNNFSFVVTSDVDITYSPSVAPFAFLIPFDTLDYQIIKSAFYQAKSSDSDIKSLDQLVQISAQLSTLAQSSQSGSEAAEALADYIVSPQKQAAEDASSQVINSTLNNFTGNGSGAAKSSDSNAMKDVSGSLQSGLNAGGSVSGATGVFNSGSDFWGWFTQQNSNYINNPYPAPVVNNTRKTFGSGDEIVDFLTPNSNQLQDLLRQGGDQR